MDNEDMPGSDRSPQPQSPDMDPTGAGPSETAGSAPGPDAAPGSVEHPEADEDTQAYADRIRVQTRRLQHEATETARLLLEERPLRTLAVAVGAGVVLSLLLRR